ncbi:hypothetical protein JCM30760_07770 [Thiomicrorhabdus hydrogeniphila]
MKNLLKKGLLAVSAFGAGLMATASQAAFDVTTIAAEKTDFLANVDVAILLGVTFALVIAGGGVIMSFIRRGARG